MNTLYLPGWSGFSKQEKIDTFDINAILPHDRFWWVFNNIDENRELLLKYVRLYKKRIEENDFKHNLNVAAKLSKYKTKFTEKRKILIGTTVNISALGSTVPGQVKINKILCKDPNGYLVANRQRNAAVLCCERTFPPDFVTNDDINEFISQYNLNCPVFNDDNSQKKRAIGDRIMRSNKSISFPPRMLGSHESKIQNTMLEAQNYKKVQQEKMALMQMFTSNQKPRDQTYLTYPSGPFVLTGAKDPYMSKYSMWVQMWLLSWEGIPITHLKSLSIQNVVSTFKMPFTFDLERLERKWGNTKIEFIRSPFPAAIYTIEESVIKIAIERANIIKQIRKEIILDLSNKTKEEREILEEVHRLTQGYESAQLHKKFEENFMFENQLDPVQNQTDEAKMKEILESTEDETEKLLHMNTAKFFDNAILSRLRKYKGKPVCLIYTPGAIVLTGSHDIDFKTAFYQILYDKLLLFKVECEDEDKKIANDCCNDNFNVEITGEIPPTGKGKSKKSKKAIGMSEQGSLMRRIASMTQLRNMSRIAQNPSKKDRRKRGISLISHTSEERLQIKQEKLNSGSSSSANYPVVQPNDRKSKFGQLFNSSFGAIDDKSKKPRKD